MLNEDVCYMLGAFRDANLDIRVGKNYEIKFGQKDQRWLFYLSKLLKKNFGRDFNVSNNMLRITEKRIVLSLLKSSDMVSPQKLWGNTKSVLDLDDNKIICYINGFWDAEGGLPKNPTLAKKNIFLLIKKIKKPYLL